MPDPYVFLVSSRTVRPPAQVPPYATIRTALAAVVANTYQLANNGQWVGDPQVISDGATGLIVTWAYALDRNAYTDSDPGEFIRYLYNGCTQAFASLGADFQPTQMVSVTPANTPATLQAWRSGWSVAPGLPAVITGPPGSIGPPGSVPPTAPPTGLRALTSSAWFAPLVGVATVGGGYAVYRAWAKRQAAPKPKTTPTRRRTSRKAAR